MFSPWSPQPRHNPQTSEPCTSNPQVTARTQSGATGVSSPLHQSFAGISYPGNCRDARCPWSVEVVFTTSRRGSATIRSEIGRAFPGCPGSIGEAKVRLNRGITRYPRLEGQTSRLRDAYSRELTYQTSRSNGRLRAGATGRCSTGETFLPIRSFCARRHDDG